MEYGHVRPRASHEDVWAIKREDRAMYKDRASGTDRRFRTNDRTAHSSRPSHPVKPKSRCAMCGRSNPFLMSVGESWRQRKNQMDKVSCWNELER
ncbi:hypothetical protein HID58_072259 [Brassica napus]|uniref:Uncharacterized protein n=1 Tax=Brassica napus TaxID=3708 RepID=A0ABQ7Z467_BRANA|nr:hypothetical protein HID58_072259 [Brassica napus]